MEWRLVVVKAGSNRMVPTLDSVWGALQVLTSQEPEPLVEEDNEGQVVTTFMIKTRQLPATCHVYNA